ncbi:MAG TPA: MFS transporter [Sphingobacteriaceae bacterium]
MLTRTAALYKKAYSGLSRENWYLSLVMLINRSGTMVLPFMTIYCTESLNFTIVQAGYIMALFGAGSIAGAFIGGKITDKIGFYWLQVGALLTGGCFYILLSFLDTFPTLAVGTFILSLCNESFRPANSTAVVQYSTVENRTRSYSLNRLAVNLGWSLGGALGGFLASVDYHLLFWVDGATNILAAVLLLRLLKPMPPPAAPAREVIREKPAGSAYRDRVYLLFILVTILYAMCFFQLFSMQPVFFKSEWHLSEQFIGGLMALNGLIIASSEMVIVHRLEGTRPPLIFIGAGVILVGAGYSLVNVLPAAAWVAVAAVIIMTIGEILSLPFMNTYWISRTSDHNRGEYAGLYTMAWSAAQILAPAFGSQMILHFGYTTLWYLIALICLLASAGFYVIYVRNSRHPRGVLSGGQ